MLKLLVSPYDRSLHRVRLLVDAVLSQPTLGALARGARRLSNSGLAVIAGPRRGWLALAAVGLIACAHLHVVPSPRYHAHTSRTLASAAAFEAFAAPAAGRLKSVKFVIAEFQSDRAAVYFLDGHFYALHDEWYWYQLLNGVSVGDETGLAASPGFDTPQAAAVWAQKVASLPFALRFAEERLYSESFYERSLGKARSFGVGEIVYVPASTTRSAIWGFDLEYGDVPVRADIERFFQHLRKVLPSEIASQLRWLTRSPIQTELGARLRSAAAALPVVSYADLASAGEVEVYSPGLAVGRLGELDQARSAITQVSSADVLVAPVPLDDLPPAAALLSLVPLTPLSHFNVLARQRGMPSAYVAGLASDPYFSTLLTARAPVLIEARADGVWLAPMSEDEYRNISQQPRAETMVPAPVPLEGMPYVRSVAELVAAPALQRLGELGGKNIGFVTLASVPTIERPEPALAITVRAYAEHIAPLLPQIQRLLAYPAFARSERARLLALEGPQRYAHELTTQRDKAWAQSFAAGKNVLADTIARGGLQAMIEARAIEPHALASIERALAATFAELPAQQGLRFRSSSTLEDIEGFNGAGLYASNTGFRQRKDRKSVEAAIKRTWASYWSFAAFEERRRAGIDALEGRMAVLVHPRFDDAQELGNAVATFTLYPEGHALLARMEVDAQAGALSVTNPPSNKRALPEVTRLELTRAATEPTITRLRPSTELAKGEQVFDDAALRALFATLQPLARQWLARRNSELDATRRSRMATLDLELRRMSPAWPAGNHRNLSAPRWVIKQLRSLEPPAAIPGLLNMALPIPGDILLRTVRLVRRSCTLDNERIELLEAYTAAGAEPQLGYDEQPFIALATLERNQHPLRLTHLDFERVEGRSQITLRADAATRVGRPMLDLTHARCTQQIEAASQRELLHEIATRAHRIGGLPASSQP